MRKYRFSRGENSVGIWYARWSSPKLVHAVHEFIWWYKWPMQSRRTALKIAPEEMGWVYDQ